MLGAVFACLFVEACDQEDAVVLPSAFDITGVGKYAYAGPRHRPLPLGTDGDEGPVLGWMEPGGPGDTGALRALGEQRVLRGKEATCPTSVVCCVRVHACLYVHPGVCMCLCVILGSRGFCVRQCAFAFVCVKM